MVGIKKQIKPTRQLGETPYDCIFAAPFRYEKPSKPCSGTECYESREMEMEMEMELCWLMKMRKEREVCMYI